MKTLLAKIFSISKKDALIRFSSASELLFFLGLPMLFTFVLGGGFGGAPTATEQRLPLLLVDQDGSTLSADLIAILAGSDVVEPTLHDLAEAETLLQQKEYPALLLIPAGFEADLTAQTAVNLDFRRLPNDQDAVLIEQVVTTAVDQVSRVWDTARRGVLEAEKIQPFASDEAKQAYFDQLLATARIEFDALPERVSLSVPASTVTDFELFATAAHQSAGQLVTWVLIPLLAIASLFSAERTHGTLRRLLTTPTNNGTYILGTIVGQLSLALVQMLLLVLFGVLVMKVNWGQSPLALAIMMVSFGLAAVAMGTMIGTFTKTEEQAGNLSIMLGMAMALLGGCWWPLELFPAGLKTAVQVLPTTWAMQGFSNIVIRGVGPQEVLLEAAVLLGFAALFFVIGVWRFRFE